MTFVRVHALARRQRRRLAVLAVMLFLGGAVVIAHSRGADGHAGDGMAMCLAVMTVGAAAFVRLTRAVVERLRVAVFALAPARPVMSLSPVAVLPRTRAGPAFLQVFSR